MAIIGFDEFGRPIEQPGFNLQQPEPAVVPWAAMAAGGRGGVDPANGQVIGGAFQNPQRNPVQWIQKALQGGAGAVVRNQHGDVSGFNYGAMGVDEEGMSEAEKIAALNASLQSAGLAAQFADSNAAMQELRGLKSDIFSSPAYAQYQNVVNSALAEGEQLPTNDYAQRAAPVNAWAQRELQKNKNTMANAGLGGSELAANRAGQINMSRGSALGSAASEADERMRQAKVSEQNRRSGLARGLFSDTATPTMSIANSLANLKANRQYGQGSVNW